MTTGTPVCSLNACQGACGSARPNAATGTTSARAIELGMRAEGSRVEHPVSRRHVGEVHTVAALLDGDGRRDERQRGQDRERPIGGRPARGGENGADQRGRAGAGGHDSVFVQTESMGKALFELG